MLQEIFKTLIIIKDIDEISISFTTKKALYLNLLDEDAISDILIPEPDYKISSGDRIFFMPECIVPRFKAREHFKIKNASVAKSSDNANIAVISDSTAENIATRECHTTVSLSELKLWIQNHYPETYPGVREIRKLLQSEDIYSHVVIDGWKPQSILLWANTGSFVKYKLECESPRFWVSDNKSLKDFDNVIEKGIKIVHQKDLLAVINPQVIMTKEMFTEVEKMFESEDTNNHVLAMELMSNCDYEKSAIYLLSLLRSFSSPISTNSKKNHVNFQSLCSFFELKAGNYFSFDVMLNILKEKNLITSSTVSEVMALAKEEYSDNTPSELFNYELVPSEDLTLAIQKADLLMQAKQKEEETLIEDEDE